MSLFSKLQSLYRSDYFSLEDFHTEIVAQVLQNSPALTLTWLKGIGATNLASADHIRVETQVKFEALPEHSSGSRPDIAIWLAGQGKTELVLVESKLPSKQGFEQLQRYAEHLYVAGEGGTYARAALVFITRDYEAADAPRLPTSAFEITFQKTRWFEFYRHLEAHADGDGLVKELILFMEQNKMSLGNQFRSTDVVALESFLSAKALMDETLEGEVADALQKVDGACSKLKKASDELRDEHRYVLSSWSGVYACLVGYWLPHENPDEPVRIGVHLYCVPGAAIRSQIIDAFQQWAGKSNGDWKATNLDDVHGWGYIARGQTIQSLMSGPDHVRAIKDFLLAGLKELEAFRRVYPALGWGNAVVGEPTTTE